MKQKILKFKLTFVIDQNFSFIRIFLQVSSKTELNLKLKKDLRLKKEKILTFSYFYFKFAENDYRS